MSKEGIAASKDRRARSTRLLLDVQRSDARGTQRVQAGELYELVFAELRDLAARFLARERPSHTLQPTALVNEAYIRLVDGDRIDWRGKTHFRALSAMAMRRILVDHARRRKAERHGGDRKRVPLESSLAATEQPVDPLDIAQALEELAKRDERQARIVGYRYFGGLTDEEIAAELGVTSRTVRNDWRFAKAWLRAHLSDPSSQQGEQ